MKIVSLTSENIKRLTAVHIEPNGNLVEITGKNGQGKTSVLDSIWWALAGAEHVQSAPIRKGEKTARIVLKLKGEGRELIVTRKFARKDDGDFTTSITVESPEGARFPKAQTVLDELLGELAFDPLEFSRMKAREQFDALRQFVPGIDFDVIDGKNKTDYERRTEVNKLAKQFRGAAEAIVIPLDTPEEPIDEQALTDELKAAGVLNQDVERRTGLREQAAKDVQTYRSRAEDALAQQGPACEEIGNRYSAQRADLELQISNLQKRLADLVTFEARDREDSDKKLQATAAELTRQADELQAKIDSAPPLPVLVDVDAIALRMTKARNVNANVERARQRNVHIETAKKYEGEAEQLTANIDARNQAKREAIAKAKMPVPGLDFGDGVVLLDGVPFDQASDAQRLRASIAIAMAANPKLRVIRVRDGSLLDEDAMKILSQMCDEKDFQCWIERVDSSGAVGFVLEDGHVRQAESTAEKAA